MKEKKVIAEVEVSENASVTMVEDIPSKADHSFVNPTILKTENRIMLQRSKSATGRKEAVDFVRTMGYIPSYSGKEKLLFISKPDTARSPDVSPADLLYDIEHMFPTVKCKFVG